MEKTSCSLDSVKDEEGNNLLHRAVLAGKKEIAKFISKHYQDLAVQWNSYGLAPVHLALLSNRPGLVDALLWICKGAKYKDLKTRDHLSLLQYAAKNSHPTILKLYLSDFGGGNRQAIRAKINELNEDGLTALHLAAAMGNRETVAILHSNGGNLFQKDKMGMLPFHHSISNGFIFTARFIANLMQKSPCNMINDQFIDGSSCLLKACKNCFDPSAIKCILAWKGDILKTDMEGKDCFYYASLNKRISKELIEILLEFTRNTNNKN